MRCEAVTQEFDHSRQVGSEEWPMMRVSDVMIKKNERQRNNFEVFTIYDVLPKVTDVNGIAVTVLRWNPFQTRRQR